MMNAHKLKFSVQNGCLTVHFQPLSHTDCMLPVTSDYIGTSNEYNVIHSTMYSLPSINVNPREWIKVSIDRGDNS